MTNIITIILAEAAVIITVVSIVLIVIGIVAKKRHNVNIFEGLDFKFWKKGK